MAPEDKCCTLMILTLFAAMFMFISLPGSSVQSVDQYGHIGGFISGLLLSLVLPTPILYQSYEKSAKITGAILLALFIALCLVYFYFIKFAA